MTTVARRSSRLAAAATGLALTLLLTAPLLALMLLAQTTSGLAFAPFDVFDWVSRILPGGVITAGIDGLVRVLSALGLSVADTAKFAEQALATGLTLAPALLGGAIFFAQRRGRPASYRAGLVMGLVTGLLLAAVSVTRQGANWLDGVWVLAALLLWGLGLVWVQRRTVPSAVVEAATAERLNRRQFVVRLGGAAALITVAGAGISAALGQRRALEAAENEGTRWSEGNALPNAGAAVAAVQGTRPEYTPLEQYYRIDINLTPPALQEDEWRLRVEGLVDTPLEYTLAELRAYDPVQQFITMACISNPVGGELTSTTRWTGVPLQRLLPEWGLQDTATHLRITSADGFFEYVALEDVRNDERIMLAYAWDGVPLRIRNGFPLRVYLPDRYGMKQPKWIERIEAVDAWEPGYWVVRSWDRAAQMRAVSVIDTVGTDMMVGTEGSENMSVPIGGMAHAGARGVSRVEVRVDDGEWQEAELREPMSELTWTLWRFDWPFSPGEHTFTVRCFEGDGTEQLTERRPPHPSGATGLYSDRTQV